MQYVSNTIIASGTIALLVCGAFLSFYKTESSPAILALLGFAFLFAVLLLLAKFKRFKFSFVGMMIFEGEMWEQTQEEAEHLLKKLEKQDEMKKRIKENIKDRIKPGPVGHITPQILQQILIDITDAA